MGSDKQTPAPKVSSTNSQPDVKGKRKEPAVEHLEVGPEHGVTEEANQGLIYAKTPAQKQEEQNNNFKDKENTENETD